MLTAVASACHAGSTQQYAGPNSSSVPGAPRVTTSTKVSPLAPKAGFLSESVNDDGHTFTVWNWDGTRAAVVHGIPLPTRNPNDSFGSIAVAPNWMGPYAAVAPDGTRFLANIPPTGLGPPSWEVTDLTGRVLNQGTGVGGVWATDSRHVCGLSPIDPGAAALGGPSGPAALVITDGSGARHTVGTNISFPDGGALGVVRCDIAHNEAVVAGGGQSFPRIVSLSNGTARIPAWANADTRLGGVSGNGRYAAVYTASSTGSAAGRVVDTATGKTVAKLTGIPDAISWNGNLVVETTGPAKYEIVDWVTGGVVWKLDPVGGLPMNDAPPVAATRAHTDDLAINATNVPGMAFGTLEIVTTRSKPKQIGTTLFPGIV